MVRGAYPTMLLTGVALDAMQSLSYKQHDLGEIKDARLERNCGDQPR